MTFAELMDEDTCLLPGGYVDPAGAVHRDVQLAPLTGREEELLADRSKSTSAAMATSILGRCIRRLGSMSPVSADDARRLLVADRQYLLLKLREVTFGDQVQAHIFCPWPGCGKKFDIDFSMRDIPVKESEDKGPMYNVQLSPEAALRQNGEVLSEVVFRLPTGADQEAISPLLCENEATALTRLLDRCIQSIGRVQNPNDQLIARLSPRARMEIEGRMQAVAPQVQMTMEADCPECGREFAVPFDLQDFFFGELRTSRDLLYREVHYLAYHYHWSEREIMRMPREKRHQYIEVLADEIERLNSAIS